ncbi:enoyl-CoA hydratase-related protein [Saccharothrix longispora]|uniref:Polyketide biosynthesis enoyl-CoA hydratase PksH n=1 Tax=Saccharothrix longispora TaxID=33920 RepID=A0ABU1PVN6_9PSEU|nr:enoyl-CoA hydratase-related protein [Saccharothrix longispora]MDR6594691.1 polyketide biosynthesis enoyl-CoA hydratase PksH [Saccharothrix longispora]
MELTTTPAVRASLDGEVCTAVLDRPGEQNSITGDLLADLHRVLDAAEADPRCRVVVLRATGGVFCSGMDLASAADPGARPAERGGAEFLGVLRRLTETPRVVVAQVDGRVTGGGVGIVAACDLVHATVRTQFSLPEALWGLLPACVTPFLIRRSGFQAAYSMTLTTTAVDVDRAQRWNLVDEAVSRAEEFEPLLRRLVFRVGKVDPVTVGDVKRYFRRMWIVTDEVERTAVAEFRRLLDSATVRERMAAFVTEQRFPWER